MRQNCRGKVNNMKKKIAMIFYLIFSLFSYSESRKNILILHSYSGDYLWTRQVHVGILEGLEDNKDKYSFSLEYMDTKNFSSEEYIDRYDVPFTYKYALKKTLRKLSIGEEIGDFAYKYVAKKIDLVIAVDDRAFLYALSRRKDILKDVPILGTGLSTMDLEFLRREKVYQMIEQPDYEANIKLALKQNPGAEKIYFITDLTITGQNTKKEVEYIMGKYDIEREWLDNFSLEELKTRVKRLKKEDIVIFLLFSVDRLGASYDYYEPIADLSRVSEAPIYINWNFYLNTGAFGGYAFDGREMGVQTFEIAQDILEGERIPKVIGTKQRSNYIFDYNVVREKFLETIYYPEGTIFINKPETFYEKNRDLIITFLTVITIITTILILVYLNLVKQRVINSQNKELLNTQKDILYRLGNVIEYRSRETANHVGRVAKISKFIALKMGFSPKEAEVIEIASPLHDVGKIGISDETLNFPGRYSKEQFEEMKKHADIGYDILKGSDKKIIEAAAAIAHEHHERWDGEGYPRHLKKDEINIFAKITMVADVIDALSHERVYKKAWTFDETVDYIVNEKGKMFDPKIVEVVETHREEIEEIIREE